MMGERTVMQEALFYSFRIEDHVPHDHLLRSVDRFVDLTGIREHLKPFYSSTGRPSVDPELMIRMLLIGYCMGIRSERRLCEEVHLNLAYRWFCRLDLEGSVPDHSTFSKNRHGRFRDSDLLRKLFEMTVERCMREGLVGAEGFAVDASLIRADVHRQRSVPGEEGLPPEAVGRAVAEYLEVLDDAAFGGATPVEPKRVSLTDPAARWTAATRDAAFYSYDAEDDSYLCPGGKRLRPSNRNFKAPRPLANADGFIRYRASQKDCQACNLKQRCAPRTATRKIVRSVHEGARDLARDISKSDAYLVSRRQRRKVEMLFAHLKRILKLDRLRLRGPNGAKDEFHLAATAQNLRKLAKMRPMPGLATA